MSEKITVKETANVGEIEANDLDQARQTGQIVLEVFNSETAGIAESTEEVPWDSFQVEGDEAKSGSRVVVVPSELAEELEAA